MTHQPHIRLANLQDCAAIAAIYNQYVKDGFANYESQLHTPSQRNIWLSHLTEKNYPVFVAEMNNSIAGFAALTPFHPLPGYRFTATGSIYVSMTSKRQGIGKALAQKTIAEAKARGIHSIIAGINAQNHASIEFHKSLGFHQVGLFKEIGHKDGSWHDDVCLQLILSFS